MKNNSYKLLIVIFLNFFLFNISFSDEIFNFDVTEVEILEEGNIFIGKKKVPLFLKMVRIFLLKIFIMINQKIYL